MSGRRVLNESITVNGRLFAARIPANLISALLIAWDVLFGVTNDVTFWFFLLLLNRPYGDFP